MTKNQTVETRQAVEAVVNGQESRLERWIQDPFASAYLATFSTLCAITFVLTGMAIVNGVVLG